MKKMLGMLGFAVLAGVIALAPTGCQKDKKAADSSKSNTPAKKTDVTFKAASQDMNVEAGKSTTAKITLNRGAEAKKEAKFTVEVDPKDKGVTATAPGNIEGAKDEGEVKIETTEAAKGKYTIKVTGNSEGSEAFKHTINLTVNEKKAAGGGDKKTKVEVAGDKDAKIKVGDTKKIDVTYTIESDAKIKTIAATSSDAKIATVTVTPDKLDKNGKAEVTITGVAEGTADITITATGDPSTPATVEHKIKITVEKK